MWPLIVLLLQAPPAPPPAAACLLEAYPKHLCSATATHLVWCDGTRMPWRTRTHETKKVHTDKADLTEADLRLAEHTGVTLKEATLTASIQRFADHAVTTSSEVSSSSLNVVGCFFCANAGFCLSGEPTRACTSPP